jgi:hypothetical protein
MINAQIPVKFRKVIGNDGYDYGFSASQTTDKGYIIGGATSSFGAGNSDMYAVKTDSMGIPILHKTFGGINLERGLSIRQTSDKGYIFLGYTNSYGAGGYDVYLVKIDSLFNTQWEKTYGGSDWDFGNCIEPTSDGGYIICGSTYSFGNGDQDYYLIKTDSAGDTLWTKTYGGANEDIAKSVIPTSDGGYILTGSSKSLGDTNGDVYTIKTTANGDTMWTNRYGGPMEDSGNDILESISGSYLIGGETTVAAGDLNGLLLKISVSGSVISNYPIGGSSNDVFNSITEDSNGRVALLGNTNGFGSLNGDMYFFIVNSDWTFFNSTTYGTVKNDYGFSVETTEDKGWIICGQTNKFNNGLDDIYLIKTDTSGLSGFTGSESFFVVGIKDIAAPIAEPFTLYPNPATDKTTIDISGENKATEISVIDVLGREIKHLDIENKKTLSLSLDDFPNGVYFVVLKCEKNISTEKLVIHH